MYDGSIRDYLAYQQDLPQDDTSYGQDSDGDAVTQEVKGAMGGLQVVAKCHEEITLADKKVLSLSIEESSDNGDEDAFAHKAYLYYVTASGETTIEAGTVLGRFVLPTDIERYIRIALETDDATASGSVDVYLEYLPR